MDIKSLVDTARRPEDVFGALDTPLPKAKRTWRKALLLHPDREDGDEDLFIKVSKYWESWQQAHSNGDSNTTIKDIPILIGRGTFSNVFHYNGDALKVARESPGDAAILNERDNLKKIIDNLSDENKSVATLFPNIKSSVIVKGRQASIIEYNSDMMTLAELLSDNNWLGVRQKGRHLAWIFRRIVFALSAMEETGVQHNDISLDNIMIHPEQHGVRIVGLTSSSTHDSVGTKDVQDAAAMLKGYSDDDQNRYFDVLSRYPVSATRLLSEYDRYIENLYGPRRFIELKLRSK